MKSKRLLEAFSHTEDVFLDASESYMPEKRAKKRRWTRLIPAVAALLCVAIVGTVLLNAPKASAKSLVLAAEYPKMAPYPSGRLYQSEKAYDAWRDDMNRQRRQPEGYAAGLDAVFAGMLPALMGEETGENKVCSPLNLYMALAMLAEITAGETRTQLLTLLGQGSIEALRAQATAVWNANYRDDGALTSVLASSLWLNAGGSYEKDTLRTLADSYFASTYQGEMGSDDYDQALQGWVNEQTGGLLQDAASRLHMKQEDVLMLMTTVRFQGKWARRFKKDNTYAQTFYAQSGAIERDFMHKRTQNNYYWAGQFAAVREIFDTSFGQSMWFFLPDEGVRPEALLSDPDFYRILYAPNDWEDQTGLFVNLAVPKFDISAEKDVADALKDLGVTDAFSPFAADFSPLCDQQAWVGGVTHAARVVIDEEGCTAVAFTAIPTAGAAPPPPDEVDFVLDRPFVFVITGMDNLPLFVGVVQNP